MADPADQQVEIPNVAETERGSLKVFLGMAAGVGKTYRMLQEGRADAEGGRDVVVGFLEPHGRKETVEQAGDLEFVPRRTVPYRETVLEEMDLPSLIRRAPDLALIDELAHTNAPGLEHGKRYEDVEDVLAAGIDVYLDRQRSAPREPQRQHLRAHRRPGAGDDAGRSAQCRG